MRSIDSSQLHVVIADEDGTRELLLSDEERKLLLPALQGIAEERKAVCGHELPLEPSELYTDDLKKHVSNEFTVLKPTTPNQ